MEREEIFLEAQKLMKRFEIEDMESYLHGFRDGAVKWIVTLKGGQIELDKADPKLIDMDAALEQYLIENGFYQRAVDSIAERQKLEEEKKHTENYFF